MAFLYLIPDAEGGFVFVLVRTYSVLGEGG
jgi:hypothetical protein